MDHPYAELRRAVSSLFVNFMRRPELARKLKEKMQDPALLVVATADLVAWPDPFHSRQEYGDLCQKYLRETGYQLLSLIASHAEWRDVTKGCAQWLENRFGVQQRSEHLLITRDAVLKALVLDDTPQAVSEHGLFQSPASNRQQRSPSTCTRAPILDAFNYIDRCSSTVIHHTSCHILGTLFPHCVPLLMVFLCQGTLEQVR